MGTSRQQQWGPVGRKAPSDNGGRHMDTDIGQSTESERERIDAARGRTTPLELNQRDVLA